VYALLFASTTMALPSGLFARTTLLAGNMLIWIMMLLMLTMLILKMLMLINILDAGNVLMDETVLIVSRVLLVDEFLAAAELSTAAELLTAAEFFYAAGMLFAAKMWMDCKRFVACGSMTAGKVLFISQMLTVAKISILRDVYAKICRLMNVFAKIWNMTVAKNSIMTASEIWKLSNVEASNTLLLNRRLEAPTAVEPNPKRPWAHPRARSDCTSRHRIPQGGVTAATLDQQLLGDVGRVRHREGGFCAADGACTARLRRLWRC
jgi:hypothetical protein